MPVTNYYTVGNEIIGEKTTGGSRVDYLTDMLGSVTATVNQSAQVVNTYRNKPYGTQLAKTGAGADPAFLWNGRWGYRQTSNKFSDAYTRARHYGSATGQWTTKDLLGYWSGINLYNYVQSRPSVMSDPSGLESCNPKSSLCCCCATGLRLKTHKQIPGKNRFKPPVPDFPGQPPWGAGLLVGHYIEFEYMLEYHFSQRGGGDCTMDWFEKSSLPAGRGGRVPPNQQYNGFTDPRLLPNRQKDQWDQHDNNCPAIVTGTIWDTPVLIKTLGGGLASMPTSRTLNILVILHSSSDCDCSADYVASFSQYIKVFHSDILNDDPDD